jgi:NAD(P) transhydrogenase subunit alpha
LGKTIVHHGVTIMGPANLPSTLPVHASQMYSRNVLSVLKYIVKDGALQWDPEDEIMQAACLTRAATAK